MPYCNKCGMLVKDDDCFCKKCGAALKKSAPLTCKKCGLTLKADDRFCMKCGRAVESTNNVQVQVAANSSNEETPMTISSKIDENIGLCYMCHNKIQIVDGSKKTICPICGETGDGSIFIRNYEREVQYERLNLAELPFLREGDEFFFGGLGSYKWNVLNINNGYIYAILSNSNRFKYKKKWHNNDTDVLTYNETNVPVTWETCTLRKWLNETFIERFSDKERELLAPTKVINSNNPFYGTSGGNDTIDRVFCLSIDELMYYCSNEKKKKILSMDSVGNDSYWLRSPGKRQNEASVSTATNFNGAWNPNFSYEVDQSKRNDGYGDEIMVRPCICINTNILKTLKKPVATKNDLSQFNVGQVFSFGFNEFFGPIQWRVIKKENSRLLVIANDAIRRKPFNSEEAFYCSWETSDIRKWLNDDFLQQYFDDYERKHIIAHEVTNNTTKFQHEYIGGNTTVDKVFLLSVEEANSLFTSDDERKCLVDWWLRTSCDKNLDSDEDSFEACNAINVYSHGEINSEYGKNIHECIGIRPAIWISIDE